VSGLLIIWYSFHALKVLKSPPEVAGFKLIKERTQWIKRVVIALAIFSGLFTIITLVDFLFFDYAFNFFGYPIFIIMAIITYWLGLEGFSRRKTMAFKEVEIPSEKEMAQLNIIAGKLTQAMDEAQLYKNPQLTVSLLSEAIKTKPYLVTKTLAIVFQTKFSDYVNELRFKALKKLLTQPENAKFTLLSLAFEAGFNSKASFNRTVQKITGKSPKHLKSDI